MLADYFLRVWRRTDYRIESGRAGLRTLSNAAGSLSVGEADPDCPAGGKQRIVLWNGPLSAGHLGKRNAGQLPSLHDDQFAEVATGSELGSFVSEEGSQDAIVGARGAAALDVPQDRRPAFQVRPGGDLLAEHFAYATQANGIG